MQKVQERDTPANVVCRTLIQLALGHPEWPISEFIVGVTSAQTLLLRGLPYSVHLEAAEKVCTIVREDFDNRLT